eukprot:TRINITY_DN24584_c0_g2_i1.p1 TRINITY_DN24584_c0_g2~~TRINITY_DN24584_c0_g2_i1.p1  ORF type:complete len:310 (-),score=53.03 TRINITY_DN24584_c0_g2_i1:128-1057(-)
MAVERPVVVPGCDASVHRMSLQRYPVGSSSSGYGCPRWQTLCGSSFPRTTAPSCTVCHFWNSRAAPPPFSPQLGDKFFQVGSLLPTRWAHKAQGPEVTLVLTALVTLVILLIGFRAGRYRRLRTALDISQQDVKKQRKLGATVVAVSDDLTLRVRHRPWWSRWRQLPAGFRKRSESIQIRLAGVDIAEFSSSVPASKGSKDAAATKQPPLPPPRETWSQAAKDFLESSLLDRRVRLQLIARDKCDLAVATVTHGSWPLRRSVSEELLRKGFVVASRRDTDTGEDMCGDKWPLYEKLEKEAKRKKQGVWG